MQVYTRFKALNCAINLFRATTVFSLHHKLGISFANCLPPEILSFPTLPPSLRMYSKMQKSDNFVYNRINVRWHCHPIRALFKEKGGRIKMYKRKEAGCCRCQDPICMNGKGLNCRGWGSYPPSPSPPLFLGELKRVVMPMTASHSADRDQWLMKGFGSPPDISHSLPPWQLHPAPPVLQYCFCSSLRVQIEWC